MSEQSFKESVVEDAAVVWRVICSIQDRLKIPGPLQSL
jgi:hypothetical protein